MRKVLTIICRITTYLLEASIVLWKYLTWQVLFSQQVAALTIDEYFKYTTCIMFKQLKIYKVTINTNESCMITNNYKM